MRTLLQQIAYGGLVLILVTVLVLSIIFLAPVDPTRLTFGQRSDNKTLALKRQELGLDQPLYVQVARYLRDLSPIDILSRDSPRSALKVLPLGKHKFLSFKLPFLRSSYQTGQPVIAILSAAAPQTLALAVAAMFLALLVGIPLGIYTALRVGSRADWLLQTVSVLGYSAPSYVVALVLVLVFGYKLGHITGLPIQGSLFALNDFGDRQQLQWRALVLPAIALGIRPIALILQLTRSALLDVLGQDYVRTAHAKGLPPRVVVRKHALRNALNPVITASSSWFASLLAGAFFVEYVFAYNGIGRVSVNALLNFDIPVLMGCILFTASIFIVLNILTDRLYAWLDPRVNA